MSHWPVNSQAAVDLATGTFDVLKQNPQAVRAEALRQAMLSLIDSKSPRTAHPSYWAAFVVIGEGGAAR